MARIRENTSYGVGTYGERDFNAGCCEWCADNQQGNAIKYPPVGCDDSMCSNPDICPNYKGQYGQITSRTSLSPYPPQGPEEWSNYSQPAPPRCPTGELPDSSGWCGTQLPLINSPITNPISRPPNTPPPNLPPTPALMVDLQMCAGAYIGGVSGYLTVDGLTPMVGQTIDYPVGGGVVDKALITSISTEPVPAGFVPIDYSSTEPCEDFASDNGDDELDDEELDDGMLIDEQEIIEEENAEITAGLGDNKIILYAIVGVGLLYLLSSGKKTAK